MQIIKFKASKAFAERHEGVNEADLLDGVLDGEKLEVCVPLVEDGVGFRVPRSVSATAGEDGEIIA